jgi:hypothetical protein
MRGFAAANDDDALRRLPFARRGLRSARCGAFLAAISPGMPWRRPLPGAALPVRAFGA